MTYVVTCECGQQMTVPEETMGQEGQCIRCGRMVRITPQNTRPMEETPAPESTPTVLSCPACGERNPPHALICTSCGAAIRPEAKAGAARTFCGMALGSLVLGMFGFGCPPASIVGLILGVIALRQIKESGGTLRGRGTAIAGTLLSGASVLIYLAFAVAMLTALIQQNQGPRETPSVPRPAPAVEPSPVQPLSTRPMPVQQPADLASKDVPDAPCPNNLKQIEEALKKYADKHRGLWPAIDGRRGNLIFDGTAVYPEYLTDIDVLRCPAGGRMQVDVTDQSYVYLGWLATNEKEGLALLDVYESLDLAERDKDIEVPRGQGIGVGDRLFRFRDWTERFLITDISNPGAAVDAAKHIPVIWEWPENHQGGYVLFKDGHVEFVPYPGKFPMTAAFQDRLRAVSAGKRAP